MIKFNDSNILLIYYFVKYLLIIVFNLVKNFIYLILIFIIYILLNNFIL